MNSISMLRRAEPREILRAIFESNIPAIVTYSANGKYHVAKVTITHVSDVILNVDVSPRKVPHPMNVKAGQNIGMSIKYGYCKIVFNTQVLGLEPSIDPQYGGRIVLSIPNQLQLIERRSYFRVQLPKILEVNAQIWHKRNIDENLENRPDHVCDGKLIDLSVGGTQLAVDSSKNTKFRTGQFVGVQFTPMPYEKPVILSGQIRTVFPTADEQSLCIGLQIVGLETSSKGQQMLSRLVDIVEKYHQINQNGPKKWEPLKDQVSDLEEKVRFARSKF